MRIHLPTDGLEVHLAAKLAGGTSSTALEVRLKRDVLVSYQKVEGRDHHGTPTVTRKEVRTLKPAQLPNCTDVRLLVDGAALETALASYSVDDAFEQWSIPLSSEQLASMGGATRTVGAVCGRRWVFLPEAGPALAKLLIRVREELTLAAPPAPAPAAQAPGDAAAPPPEAATTGAAQ